MTRESHTDAQIIAPAQDKYIKRTPDGIPMEVALTADLRHPNIVRTLRHASFDSQVYPHLSYLMLCHLKHPWHSCWHMRLQQAHAGSSQWVCCDVLTHALCAHVMTTTL